MDNFCEHLITIRKNGKTMGTIAAVWVMLLAVAFVSYFLPIPLLFNFIITVAAVWGGVYLTKMLNVEYEYIVTNGDFDVDIITSKSKRRRVISFNCKDIERIEPYKKGCAMYEKEEYDKKSVYCNALDEDVYCVAFKHKSIGRVCLVMQLPEKVSESMLPYLYKLVAREAFG